MAPFETACTTIGLVSIVLLLSTQARNATQSLTRRQTLAISVIISCFNLLRTLRWVVGIPNGLSTLLPLSAMSISAIGLSLYSRRSQVDCCVTGFMTIAFCGLRYETSRLRSSGILHDFTVTTGFLDLLIGCTAAFALHIIRRRFDLSKDTKIPSNRAELYATTTYSLETLWSSGKAVLAIGAIQLLVVLLVVFFVGSIRMVFPDLLDLQIATQDACLILFSLGCMIRLDQDPVLVTMGLMVCATAVTALSHKTTTTESALVVTIFLSSIKSSAAKKVHMRSICVLALFGILTAQLYHVLKHEAVFTQHPMAAKIHESSAQLLNFNTREDGINTLESACEDYQLRYGRLPPPGFDSWFRYAREHNAAVISNFDQIDRDLAPFWLITPVDIRERTYRAVQDRFNYISPLRIRSGKVTSPPMEIPTHYWHLERLMQMMDDFVRYLPDMDIAINLNDEPRVLASPANLPAPPQRSVHAYGGPFSMNATRWSSDIIFNDITPESFTKVQRTHRNMYKHATRFCSITKPGIFTRDWTREDAFLASSSWLEELDICLHPELRETRGFFVSPTNYDTTDELLPVFSQSKPSTFNDILIPSPWNFGDKVGSDSSDTIEWKDKFDRIHWRGSTSEGWATGGSWRKMLRQSMVDVLGGANPGKAFTPEVTRVYIGNDTTGYLPVQAEVAALRDLLDPDVFLVNIGRGDDGEVDQEHDHFRVLESSEFSDHWRYRFLLDTDGAAFSGRFLSFLESQSLPLKFTSVFTEWWSDRVFAYQHFVPVTLESVYAVWSYFTGLPSRGTIPASEGHQEGAQKIARDGKAWAEKVLRKDDMKLYLWRLLLEYGRLVDDERDSIGYKFQA